MTDLPTIPLNPVPFQSVQVPLSGRSVRLDVQQRTNGLYMNIWLDGAQIIAGLLCQDRTWLVRDAYFGMPGDLVFIDASGTSDPVSTGFGTRFFLCYSEGKNAGR